MLVFLTTITVLIFRRQPCNFKIRTEESKEACKKFEEKITVVQNFGRGKKSVLFILILQVFIGECLLQ